MKAKTLAAPVLPNLPIPDILAEARMGDLRTLHEEPFDYASLPASVDALFELLDQRAIPYLLVGGLAVVYYVGGRNTRDIDLLMPSRSLAQMPEIEITERNTDFARGTFRGVIVDVLFTRNKLFDAVRRRFSTTLRSGSRTIPCATPEGLLIMKLFALPSLYRQGRLDRVRVYRADIGALLDRYEPDMEPLLAQLEPHVLASDLREIRAIVDEIRREAGHFQV
jgi:hypothetical protein